MQDARAAYEGLLAQGINLVGSHWRASRRGAGWLVSTLLALREAGKPLPSCAFLMSPYADLTLSGETLGEKRMSTRS